MSKTPSLDDIIAKTREIAAARPNVVYQRLQLFSETQSYHDKTLGCVYVEKNPAGELVPSCLLGHALVNLGISAERLETCQNNGGDTSIATVLPKLGFRFNPSSEDDPSTHKAFWLQEVQHQQDAGRPWGQAVELADAHPDVTAVMS